MKRSVGRKGKDPGEAQEEARRKVLSMLPQNETRIGWSELEKKARSQRMSLRTLRKHLDELERAKVIGRDVDTAARPPRVYYQLMTSKVFHGIIHSLSPEMLDPKFLIARIGKIDNPELRKGALEALLETQTNILAMELVRIWQWSVAFNENRQTLGFYKIMIESYLAPIIINLGLLCVASNDIALSVLNSLFTRYAEASNRTQVQLIAIESVDHKTKMK